MGVCLYGGSLFVFLGGIRPAAVRRDFGFSALAFADVKNPRLRLLVPIGRRLQCDALQ